ncbi:hypothetical protein L1987_42244 [Smallanthus sonchifolius]|uniref:Uncharacterized protein n=1 Tax=Smallanthus sonchifolius TaxID=185202 RepID=A0ACB9GX19_9ASTR|nr:hypothetical protein L1987_42244 [Smallanthus sonchifolius]
MVIKLPGFQLKLLVDEPTFVDLEERLKKLKKSYDTGQFAETRPREDLDDVFDMGKYVGTHHLNSRDAKRKWEVTSPFDHHKHHIRYVFTSHLSQLRCKEDTIERMDGYKSLFLSVVPILKRINK